MRVATDEGDRRVRRKCGTVTYISPRPVDTTSTLMRLSASEEVLGNNSQLTGLNPCRSDTRIRATVTMPDVVGYLRKNGPTKIIDTVYGMTQRGDDAGERAVKAAIVHELNMERIYYRPDGKLVVRSETGNL